MKAVANRPLKLSNHTIKVIARREKAKEENRRRYGKPQTEFIQDLAKDLFVVNDPKSLRRKFQKATSTKINTALTILTSGVTPLGIMHEMLMGDREFDPDVLEVCKAIAPYVHPKLSAVALQLGEGNMTHEQALKELDKIPGGASTALALGTGEALSEELENEEALDVSGLEEIDADVK